MAVLLKIKLGALVLTMSSSLLAAADLQGIKNPDNLPPASHTVRPFESPQATVITEELDYSHATE